MYICIYIHVICVHIHTYGIYTHITCIYIYICRCIDLRQAVTRRARPRVPARHRFSKVLCIMPLYSKCTRALTFENVGRASGRCPLTARAFSRRGTRPACGCSGSGRYVCVRVFVWMYPTCTGFLCACMCVAAPAAAGTCTCMCVCVCVCVCVCTYLACAYVDIFVYVCGYSSRGRQHVFLKRNQISLVSHSQSDTVVLYAQMYCV